MSVFLVFPCISCSLVFADLLPSLFLISQPVGNISSPQSCENRKISTRCFPNNIFDIRIDNLNLYLNSTWLQMPVNASKNSASPSINNEVKIAIFIHQRSLLEVKRLKFSFEATILKLKPISSSNKKIKAHFCRINFHLFIVSKGLFHLKSLKIEFA